MMAEGGSMRRATAAAVVAALMIVVTSEDVVGGEPSFWRGVNRYEQVSLKSLEIGEKAKRILGQYGDALAFRVDTPIGPTWIVLAQDGSVDGRPIVSTTPGFSEDMGGRYAAAYELAEADWWPDPSDAWFPTYNPCCCCVSDDTCADCENPGNWWSCRKPDGHEVCTKTTDCKQRCKDPTDPTCPVTICSDQNPHPGCLTGH